MDPRKTSLPLISMVKSHICYGKNNKRSLAPLQDGPHAAVPFAHDPEIVSIFVCSPLVHTAVCSSTVVNHFRLSYSYVHNCITKRPRAFFPNSTQVDIRITSPAEQNSAKELRDFKNYLKICYVIIKPLPLLSLPYPHGGRDHGYDLRVGIFPLFIRINVSFTNVLVCLITLSNTVIARNQLARKVTGENPRSVLGDQITGNEKQYNSSPWTRCPEESLAKSGTGASSLGARGRSSAATTTNRTTQTLFLYTAHHGALAASCCAIPSSSLISGYDWFVRGDQTAGYAVLHPGQPP